MRIHEQELKETQHKPSEGRTPRLTLFLDAGNSSGNRMQQQQLKEQSRSLDNYSSVL